VTTDFLAARGWRAAGERDFALRIEPLACDELRRATPLREACVVDPERKNVE
jgi:hypothetical protein